jgi:hypothetical protein
MSTHSPSTATNLGTQRIVALLLALVIGWLFVAKVAPWAWTTYTLQAEHRETTGTVTNLSYRKGVKRYEYRYQVGRETFTGIDRSGSANVVASGDTSDDGSKQVTVYYSPSNPGLSRLRLPSGLGDVLLGAAAAAVMLLVEIGLLAYAFDPTAGWVQRWVPTQ